MIWLKRLLPLVVAAGLWFGYKYWRTSRQAAETARIERLAQAAAPIWIETARFRDDPDSFGVFRDSVLSAQGVGKEEYFNLLDQFRGEEEELLPFVVRTRELVDSLYKIEDSLRRIRDSIAYDSLPPGKRKKPASPDSVTARPKTR